MTQRARCATTSRERKSSSKYSFNNAARLTIDAVCSRCKVQRLTLHVGIRYRRHIYRCRWHILSWNYPPPGIRFPTATRGGQRKQHLSKSIRKNDEVPRRQILSRYVRLRCSSLANHVHSCRDNPVNLQLFVCSAYNEAHFPYAWVSMYVSQELPSRVKFLWNVLEALIVPVPTTKPNLSGNDLVPRRRPPWALIKEDSTFAVLLDLCWHVGGDKSLRGFKNV